MHYRAEIIIPPTNDVEAAIHTVLAPYSEHGRDEDGQPSKHAFWDWWVIGGRYSGQKELQRLDQNELKEFENWLRAEKVTVSGLQMGKHELSPADQASKVDAKWNEMFPSPDGELRRCPLFRDAGDSLPGDVLPLSRSRHATAHCVIIAAPDYNPDTEKWDGPLDAKTMLHKEIWNGVTHQETTWDGTIAHALSEHGKSLGRAKDEYHVVATPTDNWLVVTVDYHS